VLYRKREGARRLHEHGVFARFRYNDLKEAARRRTRAPMEIEWSGGVVWGCTGMVRRSTRADTMGRRVGDDEIML